jgi:hypothetical protein
MYFPQYTTKLAKYFEKLTIILKGLFFYKPSTLNGVNDTVFRPLDFDKYNAESAIWINDSGLSEAEGIIEAIPILKVTISEMSELI